MRLLILLLIIFSAPSSACDSQEKLLCIAAFEYKPFVDPERDDQGYISQIAIEAFALQGYKVQLNYMPLKRALYEAQVGNVDGILGAYYAEERAKYLIYSDPIADININFLTLVESGYEEGLVKNLLLSKVSVLRGTSLYQDMLDEGFLVEESADNVASLKKLLHNRVGLVIGTTQWLFHDLTSHFSAEQVARVKVLSPAYQVQSIYFTLSYSRRDVQALMRAFNKGLRKLKQSGRYQEILDFHQLQRGL
jgi:polar amino acid transport system substrate-binding protein